MTQAAGNILVLGDDQVVRKALRLVLSLHKNYRVLEAGTVEEALFLLAQQACNLLIVDLQAAEQVCLEVLRAIRARYPQLPVVMMTVHGSTEMVVKALREGVNDFIIKPYQARDLLAVVEREVSQHRRSLPPGATELLGTHIAPDQMDEIERLLSVLLSDIGACYAMLLESSGNVIAGKGVLEHVNISALATLAAGGFAATSGIATLLGEGEAFRLSYHEGEAYSAYAIQVASGVYLLIIFAQAIKLGAVLYYTRDITTRLRELLGAALQSRGTPPPNEAAPLPVEPALETAGQQRESLLLDQIIEDGLKVADALAAMNGEAPTDK